VVFSSTTFLFLFLPLFLGLYYLLPFRYRSAWILFASYLFYGWWRFDFLLLILASTLWSHLLGRKAGSGSRRAMITAVALNLGLLGYFKYFNFGIDSLNSLLGVLGAPGFTAWEVVLPVGISFYVFQATSYVIDVHRGDAEVADNFWDLAAYIALFPQLVAGPILRYRDVADQLRERQHSLDLFGSGARRFMVGFAKKVLIADSVAPVVDLCFGVANPSAGDAWLGTVAYAVQIFYDFSAYSDMAIGLGAMVGFRFRENFNRPYLASSIADFWRRWHISLSTWLRDYLYLPLGGNRRGRRRTYVNLLTVMVLGGLWHGAAWTFVVWGAWHGLLLVGERAIRERRASRGALLPRPLGVALTTLLVFLGWVPFRAPDFGTFRTFLRAMAGGLNWGLSDTIAWQIPTMGIAAVAIGLALVYLEPPARRMRLLTRRGPVLAAPPVIVGLFLVSIIKLTAESFSPFLYFQF
jgi:alginate O-acetyltransferase complex protein AlgI